MVVKAGQEAGGWLDPQDRKVSLEAKVLTAARGSPEASALLGPVDRKVSQDPGASQGHKANKVLLDLWETSALSAVAVATALRAAKVRRDSLVAKGILVSPDLQGPQVPPVLGPQGPRAHRETSGLRVRAELTDRTGLASLAVRDLLVAKARRGQLALRAIWASLGLWALAGVAGLPVHRAIQALLVPAVQMVRDSPDPKVSRE